MAWLFSVLTGEPWLLAFVGAHFILYSIPAWGIVLGRLATLRLRGREALVLAVFVGSLALEIFQLCAERGESFTRRELWGLGRYFGAMAPLLWLWLAAGLGWLWGRFRGAAAWLVRLAVVAGLGYLFVAQTATMLYDFHVDKEDSGVDAWAAAKAVAPIIRQDYKGPARGTFRKTPGEYHSSRRPVVFSQWEAAAWEVRGASEGPNRRFPGKEDYVFARVGEGYYGKTDFSSKEYEPVARVEGTSYYWVLLRRRNTQR